MESTRRDHEPEKVFQLFANCRPVRGARRSLLCDLQKHRARFIPNGLYIILTRLVGCRSAEIKARFGGKYDRIIDEYFACLLREGYGFMCDEPERFPPLDLSWDRPERITNGIIDVDSK